MPSRRRQSRSRGKPGGKRSERSLRRRTGSRPPGKLLLIVCEGAKTEPGYFEGIKRKWRLPGPRIEVVGKECGTDPLSVVNMALERKKERENSRDDLPFDETWCVFDREGIQRKPANYDRAVKKASDNDLKLAVSVPSFELWYLLHFEYTSHQFDKCRDVEKKLKTYIPQYDKSLAPIDQVEPLTETAIARAQQLRIYNQTIRDPAKAARSDRPATDVDLLVSSLKEMRR